MKKGFIKENWVSLIVVIATIALAILTMKIAVTILAVGMLIFVWRLYVNYDPEEQAAYDWWNRIGSEKRKDVYRKN